jgi:hypothetical protein
MVSTMAKSDFSYPYITGFGSSPSLCGPERRAALVRYEISRFPRKERLHMPGSTTALGGKALALARPSILPSTKRTASAPGMTSISQLNGWPMRSPTDASPMPSRAPAHGSGPMWFAKPSSQRTFTTYSLPVSRRTLFSTQCRDPIFSWLVFWQSVGGERSVLSLLGRKQKKQVSKRVQAAMRAFGSHSGRFKGSPSFGQIRPNSEVAGLSDSVLLRRLFASMGNVSGSGLEFSGA